MSALVAEARTDDGAEAPEDALVVDVDGFEGPLDMLLTLARAQKVDLRRVSVLQLARQYIAFVEDARARRIDVAAEYLVMAAWLAWLKSRLMLPAEETAEEEASGEEMAARLAHRLERLDAMRRAAGALMARDRLGHAVFARGAPEPLADVRDVRWRGGLAELMRAYARVRSREEYRPLALDRPQVVGIDAAIERLRSVVGHVPGWATLSQYLAPGWSGPLRRSAVASSLVAALELAREGVLEIRQDVAFGPVLLRAATEETAHGQGHA